MDWLAILHDLARDYPVLRAPNAHSVRQRVWLLRESLTSDDQREQVVAQVPSEAQAQLREWLNG